MHSPWTLAAFFAAIAGAGLARAISLNVNSRASIQNAASTIAYGMMSYYAGNQTGNEPGVLPKPYYWWEAGAMWGGMVEYWHYTRDPSYNDVVAQAILAQASPTDDFMMPEEAGQLGNDDQLFWAITAMTAAERLFPLPSSSQITYLDLATNVFNDMTGPRWNTSTCAGGLQWQFNPNNNGFYYKSSIANGGFFQLAARLARYTGNSTYSDWAVKAYDWMASVGLIDGSYSVYDGTDDTINCTQVNREQWSYNAGMMLLGSAVMADITASDPSSPWAARTQGFLAAANATFFSPFPNATNIMYESICEPSSSCDTDQFSFKAYVSRWMVATTQMLPALKSDIMALITPSAQAAALSCQGLDANVCGTKWYVGGWDGTQGLGQQLSALETVQGLLIDEARPPFSVSVATNRN